MHLKIKFFFALCLSNVCSYAAPEHFPKCGFRIQGNAIRGTLHTGEDFNLTHSALEDLGQQKVNMARGPFYTNQSFDEQTTFTHFLTSILPLTLTTGIPNTMNDALNRFLDYKAQAYPPMLLDAPYIVQSVKEHAATYAQTLFPLISEAQGDLVEYIGNQGCNPDSFLNTGMHHIFIQDQFPSIKITGLSFTLETFVIANQ